MSSPEVTTESGGRSTLHNESIRSALNVAKDLPELFDYVYSKLPSLYNKGGGKFGGIAAVRKMNPINSRTPRRSKFTKNPVDINLPEGFVVPIVYGLRALMEKTSDGNIRWKADPFEFLQKHLEQIVPQVTLFMAPLDYDPQKFGKEQGTYRLSETVFENVLSRN